LIDQFENKEIFLLTLSILNSNKFNFEVLTYDNGKARYHFMKILLRNMNKLGSKEILREALILAINIVRQMDHN